MPEPSNTSFIPKQSPKKRTKRTASRQVYVFTLISYTLIFASLIASAAVFFYHRYLENQQASAITDLNSAIASFSVADMERVVALDRRLTQAYGRLEHSVSPTAVLEAVETATAQSVEIEQATLERNGDAGLTLNARLIAEDFDAALFQRGVLERSDTINAVVVEELQLRRPTTAEGEAENADAPVLAAGQSLVGLTSELSFSLGDVGYEAPVSAGGSGSSLATSTAVLVGTSSPATTTPPEGQSATSAFDGTN